jgi:hypothetical protein
MGISFNNEWKNKKKKLNTTLGIWNKIKYGLKIVCLLIKIDFLKTISFFSFLFFQK